VALPISKDFAAANGTALTTYDSNFQNNSGALVINTNGVCPNSSTNEIGVRWNGDSFNADQYSQGTLAAKPASDSFFIGVGCRHAAAGTASYYLYYTANTQTFFGKLVAGSFTAFGAVMGGRTVGDVLRIEAEGTTIRAKINGAQQRAQTDSALASGAAGLTGYDTSTTLRLDDWEAGNLGGTDATLTAALATATALSPAATISAIVPTQYARPASTVTIGTWTDQAGGTTNIHTTLDETSADDADYVRSVLSPAGAAYETALSSIPDPASSTTHVLRYRLRKEAAGNAMAVAVALMEGATQRAAWTESDIGTAWATVERTLTGGEADSITNYADLRVRLTATETAPAAVSYVGSGAAVFTATSGATMAPQAPAGRQAGDILVLVAHTSGSGDFNDTITNWTKLASGTEANTTAMKVECWWRTADNSANDHATVGGIANTNVRGARIIAARNVANQAPTVARSNNAASDTVTFANNTATAAGSLSALVYTYVTDPNSITQVSGFSVFDPDTTTLGADMTLGADAARVNAASGTVNGGTATVSGGAYTTSVNVGLHFVFEPATASVPARANVSWIEFATPEAAAQDGTLTAALATATALAPVAGLAIAESLVAATATATATSPAASLSSGATLAGALATATALSPVSAPQAGAVLAAALATATANSPTSTIAIAQPATLTGALATATATSPVSSLAAGATLAAGLATATAASPTAAPAAGATLAANLATATALSPASTVSAGQAATLSAGLATATATSPGASLAAAAILAAALATATAQAHASAIAAGQSATLSAGLTTATAQSPASSLAATAILGAALATATATSPAATAQAGATLAGALATATAASAAATLSGAAALEAGLATATALALTATITGESFFLGGAAPGTTATLALAVAAHAALALSAPPGATIGLAGVSAATLALGAAHGATVGLGTQAGATLGLASPPTANVGMP
jgi:hypothetical protein